MELTQALIIEAVVLLGCGFAVYTVWLKPGLLRSSQRESDLRIREQELKAKEALAEQKESLVAEHRKSFEDVAAHASDLEKRSADFALSEVKLERRLQDLEQQLESLAGMTRDEARAVLLQEIAGEARAALGPVVRKTELEIAAQAERLAQDAALDAMQRSCVEYVSEATTSVVEISGEDVKGRIIGREGRNIRAFEQTTGVDLIVDQTPGAVVLSCFDPMRREAARLTLEEVIKDGRIQPARIEEVHQKSLETIESIVREAGTDAMGRAGVGDLPLQVVQALGRLKFRASYGQNVLDHSVEVARMCGLIAAELGFSEAEAKRAGLLHDIGKALGPEFDGPHALTGMAFLAECGESETVLNAVGAHHHEIEPASPIARIVIVADTMSASRPGARRETLEAHTKRLSELEAIANAFEGVDRSYAVQSGREVRLMVRPDVIDDLAAVRLAGEVARRIEAEMQFPGEIKVTVIRELRATEVAK